MIFDSWRVSPKPIDRLSARLRSLPRCVSVRVAVNEFQPSRNMRRILEHNADLLGEMRTASPSSEQYSVFRAYLDARHHDGGMADMTVLDYAMMSKTAMLKRAWLNIAGVSDSVSPAAAASSSRWR